MAGEQLQITSDSLQDGRCSLIRLQGPLTLNTLFPFRDAIQKDTAEITLLDFEKVPYVDSAGAGMIVNAYVSRQRHSRKFALIGVVPRVRELMRITKIDSLFRFYDNVEQARSELEIRSDAAAS